MSAQISALGFGLAGAAYCALFLLLVSFWRSRSRRSLLPFVAATTAAWAILIALNIISITPARVEFFLVEMVLVLPWLLLLLSMLRGAVASQFLRVLSWSAVAVSIGLLMAGLTMRLFFVPAPNADHWSTVLAIGLVASATFVLFLLEQLYRNARQSQRNALKFFVLGVGAAFFYLILVFGDLVLHGELSSLLWDVRGFVMALTAPFIAIAVSRERDWDSGFLVSRQVVLYSAATAIIVGGIVTIALVTFYLGKIDEPWRKSVQILFVFISTIFLLVLLFSARFRSLASVYIAKSFLAGKYDYRWEWLRLLDTLTASRTGLPLGKRAIKSLAQILGAESGCLWLTNSRSSELLSAANWNRRSTSVNVRNDDALIGFLGSTGWIIDVQEFLTHPESYDGLLVEDLPNGMREFDYLIPLIQNGAVIGILGLADNSGKDGLNFEDFDLLKAAAQQVASYLAQEIASEQIAESRQFDAYNRLTAFLMHDLKNLLAQQSLIVENAQNHRDNPEFIDDTFETIRGGVTRIRRIIEQLQRKPSDRPRRKVVLEEIIVKTIADCSDRLPTPRCDLCGASYWVSADVDALHMAIVHAVRNAQDAAGPNGRVEVESECDEYGYKLRIIDDGDGMDDEFIDNMLFTPFFSTKGTQGMGIGAYQIRETLRSIGGDVSVTSEIGHGTTFSLNFPANTLGGEYGSTSALATSG